MKKNLPRTLAAGRAAALSLGAAAAADLADRAREKKWANEVVPGLGVGDPVYLQTPRGHHTFLALYTPADTGRAVIVVHGMGSTRSPISWMRR